MPILAVFDGSALPFVATVECFLRLCALICHSGQINPCAEQTEAEKFWHITPAGKGNIIQFGAKAG